MRFAEVIQSAWEFPLRLQLQYAIRMGNVTDVEHFADELRYDDPARWKALGLAYRNSSLAYGRDNNPPMAKWALEQGLRYDIASANGVLKDTLSDYTEDERRKSSLQTK